MKTLEEIKKEFEELLGRIWKNKASSIDGRMIWNVNDDDDPDDGWVYVDETIWQFIQSTISQTKQELIEETENKVERCTHYYRSVFSRDCSRNETEEEKSTEMLKKTDVIKLLQRLSNK